MRAERDAIPGAPSSSSSSSSSSSAHREPTFDLDAVATAVWRAGVSDGAGRPLSSRLRDLHAARPRWIVANAVDDDPLSATRTALLVHRTRAVLSGLRAVALALGAGDAVLALRAGAPLSLVDAVRRELAGYDDITVRPVPRVHPAGDPVVLADLLGARLADQRCEPPPGPGEIRWRAIPSMPRAAVLPVESLAACSDALRGVPFTHRFVTVAGAVRHPSVWEVPLGTPLAEIAAAAEPVKGATVLLAATRWGLRTVAADAGLGPDTGVLFALPADHSAARPAPAPAPQLAASLCASCRRCTDLCPRWLAGASLEPHRFHVDGADADPAADCIGCRLCELVACPHSLTPWRLVLDAAALPEGITLHPPAWRAPDPLRNQRRVPLEAVRVRLGLESAAVVSPGDPVMRIHPGRVRFAFPPGPDAPRPVGRAGPVEAGDRIARVAPGAQSLNVHAPMAGWLQFLGEGLELSVRH